MVGKGSSQLMAFSDAQIVIRVKTGYMSDALALIVIGFHRSTCVFSAPELPRMSEVVEYVNLRELRMPFRVRLWHTNHNATDRWRILQRIIFSRLFDVIHAGNVMYPESSF